MKIERHIRSVKHSVKNFCEPVSWTQMGVAAIDRLELFAEQGRWANVELPALADVTELVGLRRRYLGLPSPGHSHIGAFCAHVLRELEERSGAVETPAGEIRAFDHGSSAWEPDGDLLAFLFRFKQALAREGVSSQHSVFVCRAFEEILSNAQEHSFTPERSLATYEVRSGWWMFSVTDFGVGIAERLRANTRYSDLLDLEAVAKALEHGTSTFEGEGRGFGFTQVFTALTNRNAKLRIRSGRALVTWTGIVHGTGERELHAKPCRIGTHVRAAARIT